MKIRNILLSSLALATVLFAPSCSKNNDEPSGAPSIELNPSVLAFEKASSSQTFEVVATRAWKLNSTLPDWVSIEPKSGKATNGKDVKVTVLENTGLDRTAEVKVTIGFDEKTLTINQKGSGSADDAIVYKNDFDKEEATQTYGTSKSWPYLDQFDGWKNETGNGIANVSYTYKGMSARANSESNSGYSDYEGSGSNNLFFGANAYFSVQNLTLSQGVNYTLTFGSERYVYNSGSNTFNHSEFHVYVSSDAKKWVELEYTFPNGDKDGKWDQASSTFTVPEGTTTLSLYFKTDVASAYRLDDVDLSASSTSGTVIDFSKGAELDGGSSDDDYSKAESKTVAEFIAAANTTTYYKLKGKVSGFNSKFCSFDITDDSGSIYVYSVTSESKTAYADKIKNGGTVEIAGKYLYYESGDKKQHEVVDAQILSYEDGEEIPSTKMTIAEVLAAASGTSVEVEGIVAGAYSRGFVITDGTDYLLIYDGSKCAADVKDKVSVTGTTTTYSGLVQVGSPTVTVVSQNNELNLPDPKVLDAAAFDAYSSDKIEYISYTGTLSVSGNYTNVKVAGASTYTGSLTYIPASFDASSFAGKVVKVTGFFVGISGSSVKYINTMVTELTEDATTKYFSVSETSLTAKKTDTSASFKVNANVKWTAVSDNADYTVSPASGEGSATVTITFAANNSDVDKIARITVSTTEEVETKSYEIELTHSGAASVDYSSDVEFVVDGDNKKSYAEKVKINGDATEYYALKLGTSSKSGSATVTLPAGTTAVKFYAYAWKDKTATLTFTAGGRTVGTQALTANSGCNKTSPYSLVNVVATDEYTIPVSGVTADTEVTVSADKRAVIFAVKIVK